MSGFKGLVKDGWHPKGNDGGKESWRGDFKGINQVAGWVGKGKSTGGASNQPARASRPISSLKDPSTFGRPPQRANTAGSASASASAPTSTLGGYRQQEQQHVQEEPAARPAPPPVPYRADTSHSSGNLLPPPPRRTNDLSNGANAKPKPSLPPRLPPRRESSEQQKPDSPPPAYEAMAGNSVKQLNQGAINRLGNAGVSVPAFGINRAQVPPEASKAAASMAQSELQQRFNQMNRNPSPPATHSSSTLQPNQQQQQPPPPPQGTSSEIHEDGTRSPSTSANAFRERHNEHIQAGMNKLNGINQKYGISKKINSFIEDQKSPAYPQGQQPHQPQAHCPCQSTPPPPPPPSNHPYANPDSSSSRPDLNKRKPPPPPPPMKPGSLSSNAVSHSPSPPPLPLNTKPR